MKRVLGILFIAAACIIGFLSVRGTMPFMPIFGSSMEPTLRTGGLLMIQPVLPNQIKLGDIIVYNVPPAIREHYSYPPVVAHRVININTDRGLAFRTKGDNTGEDPFTIMPWDIRGTVGSQIPYAGFPLLFMQSKQGTIFIIVALAILVLYLYAGELGLAGRKVQRGAFAPVIEETYRNSQVLTSKIDSTEKRMDSTQQALEKFAQAVEQYAQHLASHTSAIQGLSKASQELSKTAEQQNKVLEHIMRTVDQPREGIEFARIELAAARQETPVKPEELVAHLKEAASVPETREYPPGCYRSRKDRNLN